MIDDFPARVLGSGFRGRLVLGLLLGLVAVIPAEGAGPGRNGLIGYSGIASPDGTNVLFRRYDADSIWVMNAICVSVDGSGLRALTSFRVVGESPNWSTTRAGPR